MPAMLPAPDSIGIPAPPALLQLLSVLTYALHTPFVGVALGGTALAVAGATGARRRDAEAALAFCVLSAHLAQALPVAMAFPITTGVAPLLFVQVLFGQFFYTASVFVGWTWISVIAALMLGYYALYLWSARRRVAERAPNWSLLVTLAALLWTAFALVTNMSLYPHPERFPELFNFSGTALNVSEPTFLARYLHALLNFVIIGASYVLAVGHVAARASVQAARGIRRFALKWLVGALLAQGAVSAWCWAVLPEALKQGGLSVTGTAVALSGGVLMLTGWLSAERAAGDGSPAAMRWAVLGMLGTVAMASGLAVARHGVRMASLAPYLQPEAWKLSSQWPQFILFVALLLSGLAFVGYLLSLYPWQKGLEELRARRPQELRATRQGRSGTAPGGRAAPGAHSRPLTSPPSMVRAAPVT